MRKGFPKFFIDRKPDLEKGLTYLERKLGKKLLGYIVVSKNYREDEVSWVYIMWNIKEDLLELSVALEDIFPSVDNIDKGAPIIKFTKDEIMSKQYKKLEESLYLDRQYIVKSLNRVFQKNKFTTNTVGILKFFTVIRDIVFDKKYKWLGDVEDGKTNKGTLWG